MNKIVRKTLETITSVLALALPTMAQNNISGNIQSVPSMTPAYSGITLKEIDGLTTVSTHTDSTTGNFSTDVPSGTYEMTIKTIGHRRYVDTLTINSDLNLDTLQMIQSIKAASSYFKDNLDVMIQLNRARAPPPYIPTNRWNDKNKPIRIYQQNIPDSTHRQENDFAINDLLTKTNSTIKFTEANTDSSVGVRFYYTPVDSIPIHSLGWTTVDEYNDDRTPKHMTVLIAKDRDVSRGTFCREYARILRLFANSPDPGFVMYTGGAAQEFHIDEGHAIELLYKLKINTDTRKYKDDIDTTTLEIKNQTNKQLFKNFELEQNYPNPFNMETIIQYKIEDAAKVMLTVYDVRGRLVRELVDERQGPGTYQRKLEMRDVASGTYFYKLQIKNKEGLQIKTGKMSYLK